MAVTSSTGRWQRSLVGLATFAIVVLVIACLNWAQSVLIPIALSMLLTFVLSPVVRAFQRAGLRRTPSVLVVVFLAGLVLAGVGWLVSAQLTSFADDLPEYTQNIKDKLTELRAMGKGGVIQRVTTAMKDVSEELKKTDRPAEDSGKKPEPPAEDDRKLTPQPDEQTPPHSEQTPTPSQDGESRTASQSEAPVPVVVQDQPKPFALDQLASVLGPVVEPLVTAGLVTILVIFMLINREDLRDRLIRLIGRGKLTLTTNALDDAAERISRYLFAQLLINGSYGFALGAGLFFVGVPYAILWGVLAAVLRYIPYVGPWLAAIFPVVLSLVAFEGWFWPLVVIAMFVVLELGSNMIMEPLLYGHSVGVSSTAILVAVAFWTWTWGAVGLVLATPLTVCLVVLGKYVRHLEFFDILLGDTPSLEAHVRYYQRLLAGDQDEAADIVENAVGLIPIEQVFDKILIPALTFAKRDLEVDHLTKEQADFVLGQTRESVEDLSMRARKIEARQKESDSSGNGETSPEFGNEAAATRKIPIVVCPARDDADEVAVEMFGHLLDPAKCDVHLVTNEMLTSEVVALVEEKEAAILCIAALPPGGVAHTRYLLRRLRSRFPDLKIVIGRWGLKGNVETNREQLLAAGADRFGTTIQETGDQVIQFVQLLSSATASAERGSNRLEIGTRV